MLVYQRVHHADPFPNIKYPTIEAWFAEVPMTLHGSIIRGP